MTEKAAFQLLDYCFTDVVLKLSNVPTTINIDFAPGGVFDLKDKTYELSLEFFAFEGEIREDAFVRILCKGTFQFTNVDTLSEIPSFFYRNGIAILFPYIRAFVSSITAQANIKPLLLPTLNLGDLEAPLREGTIIKQ